MIGEAGEDRCQIVANGDFQPTADFHNRENCRNLGSRLAPPMCIQFFRVSKYFDTRNYVHSRIMCTPQGNKCMIRQIDGPFGQETLPSRCA